MGLEPTAGMIYVYPVIFLVGFYLTMHPFQTMAQPYILPLNNWRILEIVIYLNVICAIRLGVSELFHIYFFYAENVLFHFVLCEENQSLVGFVPCELKDNWAKDVPMVKYDAFLRPIIPLSLPDLRTSCQLYAIGTRCKFSLHSLDL